jgi:hypothetical protein
MRIFQRFLIAGMGFEGMQLEKNTPHSLPDPSSACCVGVTGHRPNGLGKADMPALRARIQKLLLELPPLVKQVFATAPPATTDASPSSWIITPLAEGADRIVAEEGLATGYALYCPLPFDRREYEKDFQGTESNRTFRELLSKATAVQEIGAQGPALKRDAAYTRVGQEVLLRSNILIAIWDGAPPKGLGGTAQIVDMARNMGIPVIWVHAHHPHDVRLLKSQHRNDAKARLSKKLSTILK